MVMENEYYFLYVSVILRKRFFWHHTLYPINKYKKIMVRGYVRVGRVKDRKGVAKFMNLILPGEYYLFYGLMF